MRKASLTRYIGLALLISLGISHAGLAATVNPPSRNALRVLAKKRHFLIGTAVDYVSLSSNPTYQQILREQFNMLTPENEMKWKVLEPQPGQYNWTKADAIVDFARKNKMRVHGHTLVWYNSLPWFIEKRTYTRDELLALMKQHIQTVMTHYRGKVAEWDVVNEAIEKDGHGLRDTVWSRIIGPDYIPLAFQWAHEADPSALLFYNDYNTEAIGPKSDTQYQLLQQWLAAGVPINGVGLQMHLKSNIPMSADLLAKNMKRLSDLGLRIAITEMDVNLSQEPKDETQAVKLQKQADIYQMVLKTCLENPSCRAFTTWGFTDSHTWIKDGSPLLYTEDMEPKPAVLEMQDVLKDR